jgi:Profilin
LKVIIDGLKGGAAADKFWAEGVHITGEKYVVTKVEGRSIYGRKVSSHNKFPIASVEEVAAKYNKD